MEKFVYEILRYNTLYNVLIFLAKYKSLNCILEKTFLWNLFRFKINRLFD